MANRDNQEPTSQESAAASTSSGSAPIAPAGKARSRWKAHLLTFAVTVLVVWGVGTYAYIYFSPRLIYPRWRTRSSATASAAAVPLAFPSIRSIRADPRVTPSQCNSLESTGNRDTLYTVGGSI